MNRLPRGFYAFSLAGLLACTGLAISAELPAQDATTSSQSPTLVQPTAQADKPFTAEQAKALLLELDDQTLAPYAEQLIAAKDLTRPRDTVSASGTGPLGKAVGEILQARQALVDKAVARGEKLRDQSR